MERKLIATRDGSHSLEIPEWQVTYHSVHGAIRESQHVFIEAGLESLYASHPSGNIRILEMGLGTGLNALLTLAFAADRHYPVEYWALEKFPIDTGTAAALNYCDELKRPQLREHFLKLHSCNWNEPVELHPFFRFQKWQADLLQLPPEINSIDLIYFDAFAPGAQPELWTAEVFADLWQRCEAGAILTTYCSKGIVRRNMQAAGWKVEKIPGPQGKREMVVAEKIL